MLSCQKEMDGLLFSLAAEGAVPSLLLHSCCGPCSSYVLEYLRPYFRITVFFYNPNIEPEEEYIRRLNTQKKLISILNADGGRRVELICGGYAPERYLSAVAGLETEPEGGGRCGVCFRLRLEESARLAAAEGFDYFATTLTVSPHKNAPLINAIGGAAGTRFGARYLPSDFKKRGGYLRSVELSREYGLYRQNYCGCRFGLPDESRNGPV
jgi:predicted adenine nucleotide alpha hydrolase (AANH) superfamily ATPase